MFGSTEGLKYEEKREALHARRHIVHIRRDARRHDTVAASFVLTLGALRTARVSVGAAHRVGAKRAATPRTSGRHPAALSINASCVRCSILSKK